VQMNEASGRRLLFSCALMLKRSESYITFIYDRTMRKYDGIVILDSAG